MDKEHDKILFEELIKAIQNNDIKCVKNLIEQGVNLNREKYINKIGYRTPLMISIENKDDDMTLLLLENGAKADLPFVRLKDERETALNIAVKNGNYNIVNELIKKGAKLNVILEYETPLRKAIDEGYTDIAILLVNSGANYNIIDYGNLEAGKEVECRTSFELARKKGYKDVIYAMEKREKEEKLKRQELRDKYIEKMKNEILGDDELECKFSDYVIKLYTNLKMNVNLDADFDLSKIDDEKFDELLLITNYKNKKLKTKKLIDYIVEMTEQDIYELENKTPFYMRGLSGVLGVEKIKEGMFGPLIKKHNETGIEIEIRKLLRRAGEETLANAEGTKTGNKTRSFSICNFGRIKSFRPIGFVVIKGNIENIKQRSLEENIEENIKDIYLAKDSDVLSNYLRDEDTVEVYSWYADGDISIIDEKINDIFAELKNSDKVREHNEVIMDATDKDVRFIYWNELKGESTDSIRLKSVYFREKFFDRTGRTLPIFQYRSGESKYFVETNFNSKEIRDMLKKELISNSRNSLKFQYNTIDALYFFIAFQDYINEIDEFKENKIMETFIENKILDFLNKKDIPNIYDIVNLVKYAGMLKGQVYQQECIKRIFENLNLQPVIINTLNNFESSTWSIKKGESQYVNKVIRLIVEMLSELRILAKDDTINFLMPKLREGMKKSILFVKLEQAIEEENIALINNILEENLDLNFKYMSMNTPLTKAIDKENVEIVKILLDKGADVNKKGLYMPLSYAESKNNREIVNVLLKEGAMDDDKINEIFVRVVNKEDINMIKSLSEKFKENINIKNIYLLILDSIKKGNVDIVKLLVNEFRFDVNMKLDGKLPLVNAVTRGNIDMIKLLIEIGADVNMEDDFNYSPVRCARERHMFRIKYYLIENGAKCKIHEKVIQKVLKLIGFV